MLTGMAECGFARRHDVGSRINPGAGRNGFGQHTVISGKRIVGIAKRSQLSLQHLPSFYLVEKFEKNDTEKHLLRFPISFINNVPDQVLAHAVRGPVHVGELMALENGIGRPRSKKSLKLAEKHLLAFHRKSPVSVVDNSRLSRRQSCEDIWQFLLTPSN